LVKGNLISAVRDKRGEIEIVSRKPKLSLTEAERKFEENWNRIISADTNKIYNCNNELVVVVKNNGRVEKYSFTGSYQGSITDEAIKVRINGNQLIITKKNGRIEKYSFSGSYQGSI